MLKAFKKWLAKAAYEGLADQPKEVPVNRLSDMFVDSGAALVVFQIDNGFVVRIVGSRSPGFTYCADHQAIADHIVSSAMKSKLGVQSDMFEKEKQAAVRQYASNQARGLAAAQSRI